MRKAVDVPTPCAGPTSHLGILAGRMRHFANDAAFHTLGGLTVAESLFFCGFQWPFFLRKEPSAAGAVLGSVNLRVND
jgi:hypothetical protein